jgi:predicted nuclease of predicted toxin-antitoxin system
LNFLVDAQLPQALSRWLSSHGHHGTHVFDIGLQFADDPVVWEHARKSTAVIISKDEDFVDRWLLSDAPVALVWIRKGNCSNRSLMAWFAPLWPETLTRLEQGERLIELRG